jgi:peroxiredoxin
MKTRGVLALVALLMLSLTLSAKDTSVIGKQIADFTLRDYRGKQHALADYQDSKLVVVAFMGTECPLAKLYGAKLAKIARTYQDRGVAFLGIDSNSQDGVTVIAAFARIHGIGFPILKDLGNTIADRFGAERTPEVFVLDQKRCIRYRGKVDDQYGISYARDQARNHYLTEALDALLAGKPVRRAETEAVGCIIGRLREPQPDSVVTYTRDIAPLLNKRCVECHRTGEIAPFPLTTYKQVAGWAGMIDEVVFQERMPPWHADPQYGKFRNDRRLSSEEKKLIHNWVKAGAPEGDPRDLPSLPVFTTGWQLPSKPDLIVPMRSEPFPVPAEGAVRYQYFVTNPGLTEEKWIKAIEVQPGNRAVVHHILVFAYTPGKGRGLRGAGINGFLGAYVPGLRALPFPEGMAKRLPAGSRLVFQVHYTPNGSPQKDISRVGFIFTDPEKIKYEVRTTSAVNRFFRIPPGAANYQVEASRSLDGEVLLLGMTPHMHLRGKAFRYQAEFRDGKKEVLLDVPTYDFNWQTSYRLAEPLKLPAGTRIHGIAHFDNSEDNLNNPDPTRTVRWGDQTWDEMMIGYFDIAIPRTADTDRATGSRIPAGGVVIPERYRRVFRTYDKNNDNKLDRKEIEALPAFLKGRVLDYIESRARK